MSKRSKTFAGLSMVVAGAAIGAGALVSANAMASEVEPNGDATVSVVRATTDATDPISCTFDGVDPTTLFGDVPEGGTVVSGSAVAIGGAVEIGDLPEGAQATAVLSGSGVISGTVGISGPVEIGAPLDAEAIEALPAIDIGELPDGIVPIDLAEIREGTPEECAAMLQDITPAP